MKYPLSTANGDAGEFFAAYKVAKELGWPCRLFDIDIGIDAQVEILTDSRESTGRFVALQVKATSSEEVDCRYVSTRQLDYWRSLEIPVFVVLVDLPKEQMFLHLIEATREYENTPKGKLKIPFDLGKDQFSSKSAATLIEASERVAMSHIKSYLTPIDSTIEEILLNVRDVRNNNPNPDALIENMESRVELFQLIAQANAVSALCHMGAGAISNCEMELFWALHDLQEVMECMKVDYADKGDISSFLYEIYASRPSAD